MYKKIKIIFADIICRQVEKIEYGKRQSVFLRVYRFVFYRILSLARLYIYPIYNNECYNANYGNIKKNIIKKNRTGLSSNVVFNDEMNSEELHELPMDDLILYTYDRVLIHGDSDFVIDPNNRVVISDSYFNLNNRYRAYDGLLYRKIKNTAILRGNITGDYNCIPSGIMVCGKFSKNYYHELYENLIKLTVLEDCIIPQEVPIIVDCMVQKVDAYRKILDQLVKNLRRNVIYIEESDFIMVDCLYTISPVNKITSHLIDVESVHEEDYIYDNYYINKMRQNLLQIKEVGCYPRKIFISRANVKRRNFNEGDVFEFLQKEGFVKIYPENLSYEQQISIFNNADWIVGGAGAAFSNLIFCKKGCNVIGIVDSKKYGFPIFSTLAYISGCKMRYYGNDNENEDVHASYSVNIQKFIETYEVLNS